MVKITPETRLLYFKSRAIDSLLKNLPTKKLCFFLRGANIYYVTENDVAALAYSTSVKSFNTKTQETEARLKEGENRLSLPVYRQNVSVVAPRIFHRKPNGDSLSDSPSHTLIAASRPRIFRGRSRLRRSYLSKD